MTAISVLVKAIHWPMRFHHRGLIAHVRALKARHFSDSIEHRRGINRVRFTDGKERQRGEHLPAWAPYQPGWAPYQPYARLKSPWLVRWPIARRRDQAGRVIPHDFVLFGSLASNVRSIEDVGLQRASFDLAVALGDQHPARRHCRAPRLGPPRLAAGRPGRVCGCPRLQHYEPTVNSKVWRPSQVRNRRPTSPRSTRGPRSQRPPPDAP